MIRYWQGLSPSKLRISFLRGLSFQLGIFTMTKGKISEVFESFQGEGIYLGERQLFVRFFGCNLSCEFCDTKLKSFVEYGAQELIAELKRYGRGHHSVAFTGGEPLLQKDFLKEAASLTREHGFKNYLETNGTLASELEEVIDLIDIVAMDLKLPSSTRMRDFWQAHRKFLLIARNKESFLKIVVCESTDEQDFRKAVELVKEAHPAAILVLQPDSRRDSPALRQKLEVFKGISTENRVTSCVIPQVHRMLGAR